MRVYRGLGFGSGMRRGRIEPAGDKQRMDEGAKSAIALYRSVPSVGELLRTAGVLEVKGLVLPECNPYSHMGWAISYVGVPAVMMEVPAALEVGLTAYLDADEGLVLCPESDDEVRSLEAEYEKRSYMEQQLRERASAPAVSGAGTLVRVLAQIQCVEDVVVARECGADGVGEIKSELLDDPGSSAGAAAIMRAISTQTSWTEIPIRFFDFDGEKSGGSRGRSDRMGPLGARGIRVLERDERLMDEFLAMFDGTSLEGTIVVLPMVTSPAEVQRFRERLRGRQLRLGVLVETPAAALNIDKFQDVCDYFEIGVNDLTQFTMAWDRVVPHRELMPMTKLTDAVEHLVSDVARAVRARRGFASLAIDLPPTAQLVRQVLCAGLEAIAVPPRSIPRWKEQIRLAS